MKVISGHAYGSGLVEGPVIDGGAEGDPSGHTDREADLERAGGGGDKKGCSFREALQRGPGQVSVRYRSVVILGILKWSHVVQGDHSGCVKPPVDIKTQVPF